MGKKYVKFYESNCPCESGRYLTEGKAYDVVDFGPSSDLVKINDDRGLMVSIYMPDSSHTYSEWVYCDKNGVEINNRSSGEAVEPKKYVRPAMTPEARDILNSIHETVGAETRSDSIVEFMDRYTDMGVELCGVKVQLSTLEEQSKRRIENLDTKVSLTESSRDFWKSECQAVNNEVIEEQSKRKGWMIYSAIVAVYAIGVSIWSLMQ